MSEAGARSGPTIASAAAVALVPRVWVVAPPRSEPPPARQEPPQRPGRRRKRRGRSWSTGPLGVELVEARPSDGRPPQQPWSTRPPGVEQVPQAKTVQAEAAEAWSPRAQAAARTSPRVRETRARPLGCASSALRPQAESVPVCSRRPAPVQRARRHGRRRPVQRRLVTQNHPTRAQPCLVPRRQAPSPWVERNGLVLAPKPGPASRRLGER